MKRSRIRKNNRGDSLILVIGCIALLSIIGVILLAKTLDNRNMKLAEEQAQTSFFGAESGSAEMVTVIETVAHEVIEDAFADMLIEYSLASTPQARKDRFSQFFSEKIKQELSGTNFQQQLQAALGTTLTDLTVSCDDVVIEAASEAAYTQKVRVKNAVFSYTTTGSKTTITTDICIEAKIPDVESGFNSGISCDFADFAIITDDTTTVSTNQDFEVSGNVYIGSDLITTGSDVATKIKKAKKFLVKNEMIVEPGAQVWVDNGGLTFGDGEGIWAGGITVKKGLLNTENVNVYVVDDLSVEGKVYPGQTGETKVVMKGSGSEYVGFSGGASSLSNHQKSSAVTINEVSNLTLDLSELGNLYINGNSYICEDNSKWGNWDSGSISSAEGILQGETIAYKDMQAMYLYPGSCLPQGHNPIIGENVTVGTASMTFSFKGPSGTETLNLANYVDAANPYVTRTAVLDGGATVATYVYLNFASEAKAAQYVRDYLASSKGAGIKSQITNMGISSMIKLPAQTITLSNALSYVGGTLEILPSASSSQLPMLNTTCLLAKQRYRGLFSTLRAETGVHVANNYKMVSHGIVNTDAFSLLAPGADIEVSMVDPVSNAKTYKFYVHNGDLTITGSSDCDKYRDMNGILLVNGNLTIAGNTKIKGLVLATKKVNVNQHLELTADATAVETLLTNDDVAKYFRVYGDTTGNGYLSSESVKISFENWKRN